MQEMVVPHMTVRAGQQPRRDTKLADARWTGARCRIEVDGLLAGLNADIRSRQGDAGTSFLVKKQTKAIGDDETVVVFLENDADIGTQATIVLLNASEQVINSLPTTLGVNP